VPVLALGVGPLLIRVQTAAGSYRVRQGALGSVSRIISDDHGHRSLDVVWREAI
jgi:hypothetical protein